MTSPPKLGFSARLWIVRIGITAAGALIATPQPYRWLRPTTVDIRVFRQQVSFNNFHHIVDDARDAVHAGSDTEQVSGADAAIGVAIPFKGVTGQRRQRLRNFVCQR